MDSAVKKELQITACKVRMGSFLGDEKTVRDKTVSAIKKIEINIDIFFMINPLFY